VGGALNPDFVEWLMGWPRWWSSLEPLAIEPNSWYNEQGDNNETKAGPSEVLQNMQHTNETKKVWEEIGGFGGIHETGLLLPRVYGAGDAPRRSDNLCHEKQRSQTQEERVRRVRNENATQSSPHQPEHLRQSAIEPDDIVRILSCEMALGEWENHAEQTVGLCRLRAACSQAGYVSKALPTFQEVWQSLPDEAKKWSVLAARGGPWVAEWPGVPRVATGVPDRVARLRMLGNGWVPQCAMWVAGRIAWARARGETGDAR
jgi:hypothetical protein